MPNLAQNVRPKVSVFFDDGSNTFSYVIADTVTRHCAILDSVLNYDAPSGRISTQGADGLIAYVREQGLKPAWILETHTHADHLSAAAYIKQQLGGMTGIGAQVQMVRKNIAALFNVEAEPAAVTVPFDHLFADEETFSVGNVPARILYTPGHTPDGVTYVIGDAAFVGDTLFMPDFGTARCDFPGGDARQLYRSISKILALPDDTRLFLCHDYETATRKVFQHETTVAAQRATNVHVREGVNEDEFAAMRTNRDATLPVPKLMLPSLQVNLRGGELPPPEANGVRYLKIPLNRI